MALIPLIDCYDLLDLDPKTVRASLKRANLVVTPHPTDARIKCLPTEHLELLASMHSRVLRPPVSETLSSSAGTTASRGSGAPASSNPLAPEDRVQALFLAQADSGLLEKVACLETRVSQLSDQVAQLALLLRERDRMLEQRISTLETTLADLAGTRSGFSQPCQAGTTGEPAALPRASQAAQTARPAERLDLRRSRLPALIEYSAPGTYVIVTSEEGELHLMPDSLAWFEWLVSLSSFRFVGQAGRFSACRDGRESRGWIAHRCTQPRRYKRYLGVTERLTIASLEKMAAQVQAYMDAS